MPNTDLQTLIAPSTEASQPQTTPKPQLTDDIKMEAIMSVADLMEKGTRSTGAILEFLRSGYGITARDTAIKYRNLAMAVLAREHKPMNRENMRALEVGRLQHHIERIYNMVLEYEKTPTNERDPKWYDTWAKLMSKLNDFGARLHAITGLNEITINNTDDRKRVIFLRPGENMTESYNVTEGEVIEAEPTLSTAGDGGTA